MIKCLAFILLLGLTVSAWEFDNKRSNRMNQLSKTVGARMLAGTNDPNSFQMTDNSNQFVPIPRQGTPAINNVMDNSVNGQQLTPDQIQQLHQFIGSQTVGQQQPVNQFQQQQPVQQPAMSQFQQPTQQQGVSSSQFQQPTQQQTVGSQFQQPTQQQGVSSSQFQQPTQQQGVSSSQFQQPTQQQTVGSQFQQPTQQQTVSNQFQQQPQQQQVFRMDSFNTNPVSTFDNTQQQQQQPFGRIVSAVPMATTTTPAPVAVQSKPSALEQQLLDQQVRIQQMKEQLFNLQQQQQRMNQQQVVPTTQTVQQQPTPVVQQTQQQVTPVQQQQLQQQQQQQQQFVQQQQQQLKQQEQQQKVQQQQQVQQQQLLDQIAQQQQLTQRPVPGQQTIQKAPQMQQVAQPMNVSRIATPVRPQQPVFQQQQQQQPLVQQRGRGTDICAGVKPGDKLPHPVDETQYIVCGELGEIFLMDCPRHTVFNPHLKLCDLTTDMPLLCKSNPCLNGAKCVDVSDVQFRCECPLGFSGQTCEKFDTCSSSQPCGQDGVCLSFALGSPIPHVCLCNGGRSVGMTCAQSEQNPCLVSGSSTKLRAVNFNRAVFAHCEGARPHFKFCQPPLVFSHMKQACEWSI